MDQKKKATPSKPEVLPKDSPIPGATVPTVAGIQAAQQMKDAGIEGAAMLKSNEAEVFLLMDKRDEEQIQQQLAGVYVNVFVYAIPFMVYNKFTKKKEKSWQYGLSIAGVNEACRVMGGIQYETSKPVLVKEHGVEYYECSCVAIDMRTGGRTTAHYRQPLRKKAGTGYMNDPYAYQTAQSKASRNARRPLIPAVSVNKWIAQYIENQGKNVGQYVLTEFNRKHLPALYKKALPPDARKPMKLDPPQTPPQPETQEEPAEEQGLSNEERIKKAADTVRPAFIVMGLPTKADVLQYLKDAYQLEWSDALANPELLENLIPAIQQAAKDLQEAEKGGKTKLMRKFFALCKDFGVPAEQAKESFKKNHGLESFKDASEELLLDGIKQMEVALEKKEGK